MVVLGSIASVSMAGVASSADRFLVEAVSSFNNLVPPKDMLTPNPYCLLPVGSTPFLPC